jgi:hypothetical protein
VVVRDLPKVEAPVRFWYPAHSPMAKDIPFWLVLRRIRQKGISFAIGSFAQSDKNKKKKHRSIFIT